jgi:hypothetical protein
MIPSFSGHCLCGAITYRCDAPPLWQMHCHCDSCRRATGAAFASFFGMSDGAWSWTGDQPATHSSSPGVTRQFCPTCGTPMGYRADRFPGEQHFYAGTLDDPAAYTPTAHVHFAEHLPWANPQDSLPRHDRSDDTPARD